MLIKNTIVNKVYLISMLLLCSCDNDVAVAYTHFSRIDDIMIVILLLITVLIIAVTYLLIRSTKIHKY